MQSAAFAEACCTLFVDLQHCSKNNVALICGIRPTGIICHSFFLLHGRLVGLDMHKTIAWSVANKLEYDIPRAGDCSFDKAVCDIICNLMWYHMTLIIGTGDWMICTRCMAEGNRIRLRCEVLLKAKRLLSSWSPCTAWAVLYILYVWGLWAVEKMRQAFKGSEEKPLCLTLTGTLPQEAKWTRSLIALQNLRFSPALWLGVSAS